MNERFGTIGLIGLTFMLLCGFCALLAVFFGFLNKDRFAMVFGGMIGGIATVGMSLILVHAKPEKKPETEQQKKE